MKIKRLLLVILLCVLVVATGCVEVTGPLFGASVEIRGPDYTVAEAVDPLLGEPGYQCSHPLIMRSGAKSDYRERIEWVSATIRFYEPKGIVPTHSVVVPTEQVRWRLPALNFGNECHFRWEVKNAVAPFDWKLEIDYYDTASDRMHTTSFRASCRSAG